LLYGGAELARATTYNGTTPRMKVAR
jgi:hypothetical protein